MTLKSRLALCLAAFVFLSAMMEMGSGTIDLAMLFNYDEPNLPAKAEYRFNEDNPVTDIGATLGRVLFYDRQLSVNNTTACASCHRQDHAFGDPRVTSTGFNGEQTARHAMRLVNVDNHAESAKFWDERAFKLEDMTTDPIKDPIEMGFSGTNGFPAMDSLLRRMAGLPYYPRLFEETFGDDTITEDRMALALAQFVRSLMTFDSRFDEGFNAVGDEIGDFPNFTDQENRGKRIFFNFPRSDPEAPRFGVGCGLCHKAPSLDIIHLSGNNGVIGVAGDSTLIDLTIERSPSIKNLFKPDGSTNGPFMHDGSLETVEDVIEHYNHIPANPDNDLSISLLFAEPDNSVSRNMTDDHKAELLAFLKTLTGNEIFTAEKWSDPFDEFGNLEVIDSEVCTDVTDSIAISICEGSEWNGWTVAGVYEEFFDLGNSCDSTLVTTLTVLDVPEKEVSVSICEGESFMGIDSAGVYEMELTASSGCDTLLALEVMVFPSTISDTTVILCPGEDYEGATESGTYEFLSLDVNGCDSLTILNLVVLDATDPDCLPSSIAEENAHKFIVYPNPTNSIIHLQTKEEGRIVVYGSNGVILVEQEIIPSRGGDNTVDLSRYSTGIYFITLFDKEGRLLQTRKVVRL